MLILLGSHVGPEPTTDRFVVVMVGNLFFQIVFLSIIINVELISLFSGM